MILFVEQTEADMFHGEIQVDFGHGEITFRFGVEAHARTQRDWLDDCENTKGKINFKK